MKMDEQIVLCQPSREEDIKILRAGRVGNRNRTMSTSGLMPEVPYKKGQTAATPYSKLIRSGQYQSRLYCFNFQDEGSEWWMATTAPKIAISEHYNDQ